MIAAKDDPVLGAMVQAKAMRLIEQQLTPALMADTMALMNSEIGFDTDRPQQKKDGTWLQEYSDEEVKQPLIVALLTGLRPVNNEFNIIAKKCYATRAGLQRIIAEWPGLTDLEIDLGVPQMGSGGALVGVVATWRVDGQEMEIRCEKTVEADTRIPVKVNSQMGIDAIHGKAKRKLYARIVERLSGSQRSIATVEDADEVQTGHEVASETAEQSNQPSDKIEAAVEKAYEWIRQLPNQESETARKALEKQIDSVLEVVPGEHQVWIDYEESKETEKFALGDAEVGN